MDSKPLSAGEIQRLRDIVGYCEDGGELSDRQEVVVMSYLPRLLAMLTPVEPQELAEAVDIVPECYKGVFTPEEYSRISASAAEHILAESDAKNWGGTMMLSIPKHQMKALVVGYFTFLRHARAPRPDTYREFGGLDEQTIRDMLDFAHNLEFGREGHTAPEILKKMNTSAPRLTWEQMETMRLLLHATAGKEDFETVKVTAGVLRAAFAEELEEVEHG